GKRMPVGVGAGRLHGRFETVGILLPGITRQLDGGSGVRSECLVGIDTSAVHHSSSSRLLEWIHISIRPIEHAQSAEAADSTAQAIGNALKQRRASTDLDKVARPEIGCGPKR